jgi:hypothetical protein
MGRLSKSLRRAEEKFGLSEDCIWENSKNGVATVPPITADDVDALASGQKLKDPQELKEFARTLNVLAVTMTGKPPKVDLPQIGKAPDEDVPTLVDNDHAVMALEQSVLPHVASIEAYQAALASYVDSVASLL